MSSMRTTLGGPATWHAPTGGHSTLSAGPAELGCAVPLDLEVVVGGDHRLLPAQWKVLRGGSWEDPHPTTTHAFWSGQHSGAAFVQAHLAAAEATALHMSLPGDATQQCCLKAVRVEARQSPAGPKKSLHPPTSTSPRTPLHKV